MESGNEYKEKGTLGSILPTNTSGILTPKDPDQNQHREIATGGAAKLIIGISVMDQSPQKRITS